MKPDSCTRGFWLVLLVCAALVAICALRAAPQVAVAHAQGILHGWLVVRSEDGEAIADGELTQIAHGERVTVRMVLRFKDGSLQDETTEYTQRGRLDAGERSYDSERAVNSNMRST